MSTIIVPAARIRQGDLLLYATSLKVSTLVGKDFYRVDTLDPEDDKGYQRVLNASRAKKLADYIVRGQDSRDAFLPTSVFLATDKDLSFNSENNTLQIDTINSTPFSVVDGQHRLEGLKMAASKDERVLEFEIPVNIAVNLPPIAQMAHFLIVNTTQKSVEQSVAQRIVSRLTEALSVVEMPSLPKWITRLVEKGEVDRAVKLIDYLNTEDSSPWKGRIKIANTEVKGAVNQATFVKAIVKYVLTSNNPLSSFSDFDKEKAIFCNYWIAVASILDNGSSDVLYKYNGVELFCKFSIPFFVRLSDTQNFTVPRMRSLLEATFNNMDGEYGGVGHPEWWAKGGKAGVLNASAINIVSQQLTQCLHKVSLNSPVQI